MEAANRLEQLQTHIDQLESDLRLWKQSNAQHVKDYITLHKRLDEEA